MFLYRIKSSVLESSTTPYVTLLYLDQRNSVAHSYITREPPQDSDKNYSPVQGFVRALWILEQQLKQLNKERSAVKLLD